MSEILKFTGVRPAQRVPLVLMTNPYPFSAQQYKGGKAQKNRVPIGGLLNGISKFIVIAIIIWNLSSSSFSQNKEIPIEFNYFEIVKDQEKRFERMETDSTHDNEFVKFQRFKDFWENRIPANGDMREYPKAMSEYYQASSKSEGSGTTVCMTNCGDCCMPSNWSFFGPDFLDINKVQNLGKINALWVAPSNSNTILAGAEGGLWKTIDGGKNWRNISDFCFPGIGIYSIAVQPDNPDIIYAGTGFANGSSYTNHHYGFGVYKTTDGGISWAHMPISITNLEDGLVAKILVHPVLYNNVYAAMGPKVFKTVDAGATWTEIWGAGAAENPNNLSLYDMEMVVTGTTDELYVTSRTKIKDYTCIVPPAPGTFNWGDLPGYWTTNFTASVWKFESAQNTTTSFGNVLLDPLLPGYNPVTVLAAISITNGSVNIGCQTNFDASLGAPPTQVKIFRKPNGSSTWTHLATSAANGLNYGFSFPFDVSPANPNIIYYGGTGLNKSTNGGATFTSLHGYWDFWSNPSGPAAGMHPDMRSNGSLIYNASTNGLSDELFWGNDGGIGSSSDGGTNTQNLNGKGLQLSQFHGISNSDILPNLIYGGTQDNGIFDNKSQAWRNYPFGDGYDAVSDAVNPMIAYVTMNSFSLQKTVDGGNTWTSASGTPENAANASLYIQKGANELYLGKNNLWKYNVTWIPISNFSNPSGQIVDIDMSEDGAVKYIAYSGTIYGGTREKKVYKFDIGGCITGCDLSTNLPGIDWVGITDIATDETGNNLWVCFGGLWDIDSKVYHLNNGVWTRFGQGLPNIPANSIEHYGNGLLFLGTDDGVYYRDRSMTEWKQYSCNLPSTIISDLEINHKTNKLRAATHSRGIWETTINFRLGDEVSCNPSMLAICRIGPNSPFFPAHNLYPNQTMSVYSRNAIVNIELRNICSGTSCCNNENKIRWTVFKDNAVYIQGTSPNILFSGIFRSGFWFWAKKHDYRVEVDITCGKEECGTKIYTFRGK